MSRDRKLSRMDRRSLSWLAAILALLGLAGATLPMAASVAGEAQLVPAKLGINSLNATDRVTLWKRVDEWATADSLLEFCGRKLNIYKRAWNAVSPCIETPSLRKVAVVFRSKKSDYLKALTAMYPEPERKKAFCDGLAPQLKEYARIINAQIAEAQGMCSACLWC